MKKYPIVMQDEMKDCGASCISMIINYYGGYVRKSNLIDMTKTNKKGTTAFNIKDALTNLGFELLTALLLSAKYPLQLTMIMYLRYKTKLLA